MWCKITTHFPLFEGFYRCPSYCRSCKHARCYGPTGWWSWQDWSHGRQHSVH
jgi:hypothetical protein